MHTRDSSEQTQHIIDEEVERILREQEERAMQLLAQHKHGLELVAKALLEKETVDGNEVGRLVDEGHGGPVHAEGSRKFVPRITPQKAAGNGSAATNGSTAQPPATPETPEASAEPAPQPGSSPSPEA